MEDTLRSGVMMDNKTNEREKKKNAHTNILAFLVDQHMFTQL